MIPGEQQPTLQKTVQEFSNQLAQRINAALKECIDSLGGPQKVQEAITSACELVARFRAAIPEMEKRMDEASTRVFVEMLDYSWYLDLEMTAHDVFNLSNIIAAKNEPELNQVMTEHFKDRLGAIQQSLEERYANRERLLSPAFEAHRKGCYALAIPIFFSQADGIFRDLHKGTFFTKECDPIAKKLCEEMKGITGLEEVLRSIKTKGTVRLHSDKCPPGSLNRHAVMHGIDVDYDTEPNSLKALSLLHFLSSLNEDVKQSRQAIV